MINKCTHKNLILINPYELIRKYQCSDCGEVMMCDCEQAFASKYLPHQINSGKELKTQQRIPVTLGFQPAICNTCRGIPEDAYPKKVQYGSSSKIKRYYWREIFFSTTIKFYEWLEQNGYDKSAAIDPKLWKGPRNEIEKEVVKEIAAQHKLSPKYNTDEESEESFIRNHQVEVLEIKADVLPGNTQGEKSKIKEDEILYSIEEYGAKYFKGLGYEVIFCESVPIHVLFGIFMYLLIQDYTDPERQFTQFGSRTFYETKTGPELVSTFLPTDFGTEGYALRRQAEIDEHINSMVADDKEELDFLFSYWLGHSNDFREYLWAHRIEDIERAKKIFDVLSPQELKKILRYLISNYWGRYLGWPDLFIYKDNERGFVEVKARSDKLTDDQRGWIVGNENELNFPFTLLKIHKKV